MAPTPSLDPADPCRHLRAHADDEALIRWSPGHIALLLGVIVADASMVMSDAAASGCVYAYAGGRHRERLAYFVGMENPGGISLLPPPSIQSGGTLAMYRKRDGDRCHLCQRLVSTSWDRRREWPSLDHLTPRMQGGSDYPSNIRLSHVSCNKARGDRPIEVFGGSPLTRALAVNA